MPRMQAGRLDITLLKSLLLLLVVISASSVYAAQPRLVIAKTEVPQHLSAHGRYLLGQTGWVSRLSLQISKSGSARVLTRDSDDLRVILGEGQLARSSLAAGDGEEFTLRTADSLLRPIVRRFDVATTYTPVPLVENRFERRDSVSFEYEIRVLGTDGTEKFKKILTGEYHFPEIQETLEQRKQRRFRNPDSLQGVSNGVVDQMVNAIVVRINPITVIAVRDGFFVIDRGEDSGVSPGDRLQVYTESETIVHNGKRSVIPGQPLAEAKIYEVHEDVSFVRLLQTADDAPEQEVQVGYTLRFPGATQ